MKDAGKQELGMKKEDKTKRMQELVELLNKAGKAYYQDAEEIMTNYEYDALYDELCGLEKELGITLSNSPTVNVGYEVLSELPKERHESPMLSLDKTKDVEALKEFAGDQKVVISQNAAVLEDGRTYDCADLPGRAACEGSYQRQWRGGRSYYE